MPTKDYRFTLSLPVDIANAIKEIRANEDFRRLSLSEIVRRLIEAGLKAYANGEG